MGSNFQGCTNTCNYVKHSIVKIRYKKLILNLIQSLPIQFYSLISNATKSKYPASYISNKNIQLKFTVRDRLVRFETTNITAMIYVCLT